MKMKNILASLLLIGAATWLTVGLFQQPSTPDGEQTQAFNIYAWLAENEPEQSGEPETSSPPGRAYESSPALGDRLWNALTPSEQAIFTGTGERVETRWVASGGTNASITPKLLSDAMEGAINGTPQGLEDLQKYFDVVSGNERELLFRVETLLAALGESSIASSYTAMSLAAANISESALTALWTGYLTDAYEAKDFVLLMGSRGYDFGPARNPDNSDNPPSDGFIRIPAKHQILRGSTSDVITSSTELFGDGVSNILSITDEMPDGEYMVYVLTSEEGGTNVNDAFGAVTRTGSEEPIRRVNLLDQYENRAKVYMSSFGVSAEINNPLEIPVSEGGGQEGYALAMRMVTTDGQIHIEFGEGNVPSYIVGIILEPVSPILEVRLSEIVTTMLDLVRPFAGGGGGEPTNFASTTTMTPIGGDGGNGGFSAGSSGGDGTGGAAGAILTAEGGGPHTVIFGNNVTLDGTQSTFNGELVLSVVDDPADLIVEWLFDIDGDGELDLVATDLVATIDSDLFDGPGVYEGILRITLGDLTSIDDVVITIVSDGSGGGDGGGGGGGGGSTVPEPSSAALLASGLGALAWLRRRRRTQ